MDSSWWWDALLEPASGSTLTPLAPVDGMFASRAVLSSTSGDPVRLHLSPIDGLRFEPGLEIGPADAASTQEWIVRLEADVD
jgi:hypothetical protein